MIRLLPHAFPLLLRNRLTELTLFITTTCNMKCRHCFVIEELNTRVDLLSLDEIKLMGRHIPHMQRVHISGGEPFTRKDLAEIVIAISNGWNAGVVCVPTNGWFTENVVHTIERFGKEAKGRLRIHFSINTFNEKEMDDFTRLEGSLRRWKQTVAAARKAADNCGNVTLIALATYNEFNMDIFPQLVDFVINETGVDEFSFHLARPHKVYQPVVDLTNYRRVLDDYFRNKYRANPVLRAYRELIRREHLRMLEENTEQPCRAGTLRVVVAPNGNVYPCEKLGFPNGEERDQWLMGNLRCHGYNINEILQTRNSQELERRIAESSCPCHHEIDTSLSLLSQNSFRLRVLAKALRYSFVGKAKVNSAHAH